MAKTREPAADVLHGAPPSEIPLSDAPLVSVIAQVRFPTLLTVPVADRIIGFHEAMRGRYPYLDRQDVPTVVVMSGGSVKPVGEPVVHWRFADDPASYKWRVTLSTEFIALETRAYESRRNFLGRLETIVQTLEDTLAPTHMTRLGIRYVDQIKGKPLARIETLFKKEVLGVACSIGSGATQLLTQLSVAATPGELVARWGKLPPNMTIDPNAVPPIDEQSWLLDLDVSQSTAMPFETKAIVETAGIAAERVYAVFRWMVTDEFLRTYGGRV
jgi:uncharacterized protein (TIGR04255 family)